MRKLRDQERLLRAQAIKLRQRLHPIRRTSLRRLEPISDVYGMDRGLPIDRSYIEAFLIENKSSITGFVLEMGFPQYTRGIGQDRVQTSFVLDIDPSNIQANIIADLDQANSLPEAKFDCFILTQTLQYVRNPLVALDNAQRSLKVGGTCSSLFLQWHGLTQRRVMRMTFGDSHQQD